MTSQAISIMRAAGATLLAMLGATCFAGTPPLADPVAAVAAPPASAVCRPCHGLDGNGAAPGFPRLAGLTEAYIAKQLADFASGKRPHEVMSGIAGKLSVEEIADVSRHFASLPRSNEAPIDAAAAASGRDLFLDGNENTGVPGCSGCHGAEGNGTHRAPSLAGQRPEYLMQQLRWFRDGARVNDPSGMMKAIAERLTDDEAKALSAYLSASPLRVRALPSRTNPLAGQFIRTGPQ